MVSRFYLLITAVFFFQCTQDKPMVAVHQGYALGTSYSVQYKSFGLEKEKIQFEIDSLFTVINASMSTYLPSSIISKINRGDSLVQVDDHFKEVFQLSTLVWEATSGMFDPTVGALVNAYGFGPGKALARISDQQRDSLLGITGWQRVRLSPDSRVIKNSPALYLDFNAIAKGYTVDVISEHLSSLGSTNHLIEIGGEIHVQGLHPVSGEAWKIGIDRPNPEQRSLQAVTKLSRGALATSGNYRKYRVDTLTGQKFVHSIHPKKGFPVRSRVLSASVKASTCSLADAYATALMVMPFVQGKALVDANPDLAAYWILANTNGTYEEVFSSNWEHE